VARHPAVCWSVCCCVLDYPAPSKGDRGSQAFLTENYSLAFGALRGLELDAKVNEITGEDMIQCIESAGGDMSDQEKHRILEQMGLAPQEAKQAIPLSKLVALTNDHSRPVSAQVRNQSYKTSTVFLLSHATIFVFLPRQARDRHPKAKSKTTPGLCLFRSAPTPRRQATTRTMTPQT
jgi:hypothetical protein